MGNLRAEETYSGLQAAVLLLPFILKGAYFEPPRCSFLLLDLKNQAGNIKGNPDEASNIKVSPPGPVLPLRLWCLGHTTPEAAQLMPMLGVGSRGEVKHHAGRMTAWTVYFSSLLQPGPY